MQGRSDAGRRDQPSKLPGIDDEVCRLLRAGVGYMRYISKATNPPNAHDSPVLHTLEPLRLLHGKHDMRALLVPGLHHATKLAPTQLIDFDKVAVEPTRPLLTAGYRQPSANGGAREDRRAWM